ncbi:MAG: tetratricopeptide repeat protein [Metallibacterium scheffleri]
MDDLAMAQDRLGWMYLHGQSVPQNTRTALVWMRRAAERGAPAAQLQLGDLYESGASVPTDLEKSYYWFAIAAKGMPSDVHVIDIAAVQAYASKKAAAVARMLPPARRAAVAARVAQWEPRPSVPYVGVVRLGAGAHR